MASCARACRKTFLGGLFAALLFFSAGVSAQDSAIIGDYGDAPDGLFANYVSINPLEVAQFPSAFDKLQKKNFVVHRAPKDRVYLGRLVTLEQDAHLVNRDLGDDGWVPATLKACSPSQLVVRVTVPKNAPRGPLYLNALFDWNHDGRWQSGNPCPPESVVLPPRAGEGQQDAVPGGYVGTTAPEWGVQNLRLDLEPYKLPPGFEGNIILPALLSGALSGEMWVRFTVTTLPVDEALFAAGGAGWDGRGDFPFGESEDYFSCLIAPKHAVLSGCPDAIQPVLGESGRASPTPGVVLPSNPSDVQQTQAVADLSLSKTVNDASPNLGDTVVFSIVVVNDGPNDATGVVVEDSLPSELELVSFSTIRGTFAGGQSWFIGDLPAGGSATLQLSTKVTAIGHFTNSAQVMSADQFDPDSTPGNGQPQEDDQDAATVTSDVVLSDLVLTKVDNVDPVSLGGNVTWRLSVTNNGPLAAQNVVVNDALVPGLALLSATPSQGTCDTTVSCSLGTLDVGATATVDVAVTVGTGFVGSTIDNTATVSSSSTDSNPSDNTANELTAVNRDSDLSLTKTDNPDPVVAGTTVTWTITATNSGPADASAVVVDDPLPNGVSLVNATPSQGACDTTVNCALGTIANGANATVTVVATVDAAFTGPTLSNTATVTSPNNDPNPGNDSVTSTTTVNAETDLAIVKTASPLSAVAGQDSVTWTLAVTNNGPSDAQAVTVTDTLPVGVTFISASAGCTQATGTVSCNLGTLAAGANQVLTIDTSVDASAPATLDNPASVSTSTSETVLTNNTDNAVVTVSAQADLAITKTDSPDPVLAGNILAYTLSVSNAGPSDATSVSVADTLPAGVAFVSANGTGWSCAEVTGTVSCTRATLGVGAAPTIAITVTVLSATADGTVLSNTATVSSATPDPNATNDTATEPTTVNASADLSITKVDAVDPVLVGTTIDYTITVSNAGPSDALGVSVSDPVPAGTTLVSATPSQGTCDTVISCVLGTIANGANATIAVQVTVNAGFVGSTVTNTATVSTTTNDPNTANDMATEPTAVEQGVDVSVTKTDSPDPVLAGATLTYTLGVSNAGPADALNVSVSDALPVGVTFVSAPGCTQASGTVTCNVGTLLNGAGQNFVITVTVDPVLSGGTVLNNTAVVFTDSIDTNVGNNSATEPTTVNASADLSVLKTDSPDPVLAGNILAYTLSVSNAGPSDATSVSVVDTLPAGVAFVSANGTGWSCAEATGTVTCTRVNLSVGPAPTIAVTVTVLSATADGTVLNNTATVTSATPDPNATNDSATEPTTVNASTDLAITKVDAVDPVLVGANIDYTITVTNAGPSDAVNVTVSDPVPTGTTLVSATPSQGTCDTVIGCNLGTIASGANATIAVQVTVNAGFVGSTVTNTATVSSATLDPNTANDSATEPTTVEQGVDLAITKTDSPDPVVAGATLTYTLGVSNAGPSTATNVQVSDTLPTGLTLQSATGTGWTCTGTTTVSCTLPSLGVASASPITVTTTVDPAFSGGALSNTATVSSADIDINPANNSATEPTTVNASADLSVLKTDSLDPVLAGSTLTYTLSVNNAGPSDATSVSVSDTLPAGVAFVSATGTGWSCAEATGTVTCTRVNLSVGPAPAITVTVTVSAGTTGGTVLSNTATVSSATPDPNATNDSATEPTTVNTGADLSIIKLDSPDPVTAGGFLTYNLFVTNNGPSDATGVVVTDPLDANLTFQSGTFAGGSCTESLGTVTCNLGTVTNGNTAVITITAQVDPALISGTVINNSATATATTNDPVSGNNTGTQTTNVITSADIAVGKFDTPDPVNAGTSLTWTITVTNNGPSNAETVNLTDVLPTQVSNPVVTTSQGTCSGTATISCSLGTVLAGAANNVTITIAVDVDPSFSGSIPNSATATTSTPDPVSGNNTGSATTTVNRLFDVAIAGTDTPDPVASGAQLVYTLTVTNNGPSSTSSTVTVQDTLPTGVAFVSASAGCSEAGGTVTCNLGAILPTGNVVITITVTVTAAPGSNLINLAIVNTTPPDSNAGNNIANIGTTVN